MSLLIETVAKVVEREGLTGFCSGDINMLHDIYIYDECIKRGMKPVQDTHPLNVLQRIRNGMRSGYLFDVCVRGESILRRISFYKLRS